MVRTHNGNWLSLEFNISVLGVGVMVFNATFNYISVISCRSVLFKDETGVSGENNGTIGSHWQTLSHNVVSITPHHERGSHDITEILLKVALNTINQTSWKIWRDVYYILHTFLSGVKIYPMFLCSFLLHWWKYTSVLIDTFQ
jgi:hypothetical protein